MFLLSFSKFLLHFITPKSCLKTKQSKSISLLIWQDQPRLTAFSVPCLSTLIFCFSFYIQTVSFLRQGLSCFDPCSVPSVKAVQINNTNDVLLKCVRILYCCTQLIWLVSWEMQVDVVTVPVTVCFCILTAMESIKFHINSLVPKACSEF